MLKSAGLTVHVGGNIGIGVLALPAPTPDAVYVIEVSSYQLDLTTTFAPDVAILTNISPDHLDRHGGMDGYVASKARIFQSPYTFPLIGVDEPEGRFIWENLIDNGRVAAPISMREDADSAVHLIAGQLALEDGDVFRDVVDLTQAKSLPGKHNAQNAAFALLAALNLGVSERTAVAGLLSFPGLAHRMEAVGRLGPVRFINDSKATNADAARQALSSYPAVFWIAGGKPKDGGIDDLTDLFPRVTKAYLIGQAAEAFATTLGDTPHEVVGTMEAAVAAAARDAAAAGGEQVVLLSPACASFDQYPDFEVRGEAFRAAVLALGATPETAR